MNKKAIWAADLPVLIYATITLAVFAVIFSGVYVFVIQTESGETSGQIQQFKTYELLDYYLNTQVKVNNKETRLMELIPLYCLERKPDQLELIKKVSSILLLPETSRVLGCINNEIACKDIPNSFSSGKRHIYTEKNNILILSEYPKTNLKIIEIPGFKDSKACLEVEKDNYDITLFVDSSFSEKDFESKIKEKSAFQINQGKASFVISPSKDIWRYNNKLWCNAITETDSSLNCKKGITSQELINCKGDFELC
ncbi:MAG: hypothetical protein AABW58_00540 [Nanoarchaeota archaeon]